MLCLYRPIVNCTGSQSVSETTKNLLLLLHLGANAAILVVNYLQHYGHQGYHKHQLSLGSYWMNTISLAQLTASKY